MIPFHILFFIFISIALHSQILYGDTYEPISGIPDSTGYDAASRGIFTGWGDIPPFLGVTEKWGDWRIQTFAAIDAVYDKQGGNRGQTGVYFPNSIAIAAEKTNEDSAFIASGVFSLEPFTIDKCGYPLLLSLGGTANDTTLLIDRGGPFTLPVSLGATYTIYPVKNHALFTYWALVGPPALGPFPSQRYPSVYMPELAITFDNFNATRISYGVITGGYIYKDMSFELSTFKGRQNGKDLVVLEAPNFDSYCGRFGIYKDFFTGQISCGFIKSPDITTPAIDIQRFTTTGSLFKKWNNSYAEATIGWSLDKYTLGFITTNPIINNLNNTYFNACYLEAIYNMNNKHLFFTRAELLQTSALFADKCETECCSFERHIHETPLCSDLTERFRGVKFTVGKLAGGYLRQLFFWNNIRVGIGISANVSFVPPELYPCYSKNPFSYFLFLRAEFANEPDEMD